MLAWICVDVVVVLVYGLVLFLLASYWPRWSDFFRENDAGERADCVWVSEKGGWILFDVGDEEAIRN